VLAGRLAGKSGRDLGKRFVETRGLEPLAPALQGGSGTPAGLSGQTVSLGRLVSPRE
jgi:hypothetical protein